MVQYEVSLARSPRTTEVKIKPQAKEVVVDTPGYTLRKNKRVTLPEEQVLKWELTLWTASLLRSYLDDIQRPSKDTPRTVEISEKEIVPAISTLKLSPKGEVERQVDEIAARLRTRSPFTEKRVVAMQTAQERNTLIQLLDVWVHDMKGLATVPKVYSQQLERNARRTNVDITQVKGTPKYISVVNDFVVKLRTLLETGMPFTIESVLPELGQDLFTHQIITVEHLFNLIQTSVGLLGGVTLRMDRKDIVKRLGNISANWNMMWAERFVDNIVSNTQKAYQQLQRRKAKILDVDMGIEDGYLAITFGDRGAGYPVDMLREWNNPKKRRGVSTGWQKKGIPTTGLGLKEHTAIVEDHYNGRVSLHYSPYGGAATVIALPLKEIQ